jgi:hypothetical protein
MSMKNNEKVANMTKKKLVSLYLEEKTIVELKEEARKVNRSLSNYISDIIINPSSREEELYFNKTEKAKKQEKKEYMTGGDKYVSASGEIMIFGRSLNNDD